MIILKKLEIESGFKKRIFLTLGISIISLTILEIWVVNRLSTYGEQLSKLKDAKSSLLIENQVLENQIAQETSLYYVEQNSKNLGFAKIKNIEYLKDYGLALVNPETQGR